MVYFLKRDPIFFSTNKIIHFNTKQIQTKHPTLAATFPNSFIVGQNQIASSDIFDSLQKPCVFTKMHFHNFIHCKSKNISELKPPVVPF